MRGRRSYWPGNSITKTITLPTITTLTELIYITEIKCTVWGDVDVMEAEWIMVVKRRGQNEHLKQGERTKTNLYSIISKLTLIHENITNSNILIVCIYIYV